MSRFMICISTADNPYIFLSIGGKSCQCAGLPHETAEATER